MGPVTIAQEVQNFSKNKDFLRHEIQYEQVTYPKDAHFRPHLYKVNGLNIDKMIKNLKYV